jgi:hypothetical protein
LNALPYDGTSRFATLAPIAHKNKEAGMARRARTVTRTLDARRDTLDFRDQMYIPTLIEVPTQIPVEEYLGYQVPVLDQGEEGACTGFGLATVANYLLRRRAAHADNTLVSPRMFYELARRYDEWPGEDYSGSSARGAMKGWNKHGVCAETDWPYHMAPRDKQGLTDERAEAARRRPLGAYFRVNHKDLVAMHAAIAEVGVLYATAIVHDGWSNVQGDGTIVQSDVIRGGHAFAIVAYDGEGLWMQNSWGEDWGRGGLARISYDDWLQNGTDLWVARLGAPVILRRTETFATAHATAAAESRAYSYAELRPHIVSIGNDGVLKPGGDYGSTPAEVVQIFDHDFPRLMGQPGDGRPKRLLLYAHGGLVGEEAAVQRVAEYRPALLQAGVYPLAFIWHSDFWTTITNILEDAVRRRRPEGALDAAKDFLLDRLDDALEPLARTLTGKAVWDEMKENATRASKAGGGARLVADQIVRLVKKYPELEIHLIGHSAGANVHAPLVQLLSSAGRIDKGPLAGQKGYGLSIASCTLWAPACTVELFKESYLDAIGSKAIARFALFVLDDKTEQDDHCANMYNKSLLYLVSNAFEAYQHIPLFRDGVPLLGLEKCLRADAELKALFRGRNAELILAPNSEPEGTASASAARHHNDFDDDPHTVAASFARIVAAQALRGRTPAPPAAIEFNVSQSRLREKRMRIDARTRVPAGN